MTNFPLDPEATQLLEDSRDRQNRLLHWIHTHRESSDCQALLMILLDLIDLMNDFHKDFKHYDDRDLFVEFYAFASAQSGEIWGEMFERFYTIDSMIERTNSIDMLESCFAQSHDLHDS